MNRRHMIALFLIAVLLGTELCQGGVPVNAAKKLRTVTLYRGKSRSLTVPKDSKKKAGSKYRYKSSRPGIVSVSKKGRIKGKKTGTAVVTMRRKNKKSQVYRYRVRVVDYVKDISISSASQVVLKVGEKSKIRARILPETAGEKGLTYHSGNKAVVDVSQTGEVKAVDEGMTYIDVKSKGKKKNGKKIKKRILVYVSETIENVPKPVTPSLGDLVIGKPAVTQGPGATAPSATQEPGVSAPPATEKPAQTLAEAIAAIPSPAPDTLLAANFVVSAQGRISTLYFLNRSYKGNVSLMIDGVLLQGAGSVDSLLTKLQKEVAVIFKGPYFTDSDGKSRPTFRIGRDSGGDPWVIKNRRDNTTYSFYAYASDTVYSTPYGLIVADGDTSSRITLQ